MPASGAMIGYGSSFWIGSTAVAATAVFTELAEITNITYPSANTDMVDVTHMQSPDGRREFVPGLIDPGECSFEMNFIPGSVADEVLNELLDTAPATRARQCRIIAPNGASRQFLGLLMTYEPSAPTDDKMTASVSFRVSGVVVREGNDSPIP